METEAGLWIDHREAVIVRLLDKEVDLKRISSSVGKRTRYSGSSKSLAPDGQHSDSAEDRRDRRFGTLLNTFYDEVIAHLRDAASILIMGPGEARVELQKRLEDQGLGQRIAGTESVDKMTEGQIIAQVREYFLKK